jgi:TolB protein
MRVVVLLPFLLAAAAPEALRLDGSAELFEQGRVSTATATEIRIAFSPDGTRMLWGTIGRAGGAGGWDLWESRRGPKGWSAPAAVSFNSPENDFDPFVAADGVYFFSNRPGGLGGDDLWFAPRDARSGVYGATVNLGASVNSAGDEWAPTLSPDGRTLLFATNGRGGAGLHDLFTSTRDGASWGAPVPVPGVNSADEDFDAAYLHDGRTLVMTRMKKDQDGSDLYVARWNGRAYDAPQPLDERVSTPGSWNNGPAIDPSAPGWLYFSSVRKDASAGRMDVYRIRYAVD